MNTDRKTEPEYREFVRPSIRCHHPQTRVGTARAAPMQYLSLRIAREHIRASRAENHHGHLSKNNLHYLNVVRIFKRKQDVA
jgi:hypothetical protein